MIHSNGSKPQKKKENYNNKLSESNVINILFNVCMFLRETMVHTIVKLHKTDLIFN